MTKFILAAFRFILNLGWYLLLPFLIIIGIIIGIRIVAEGSLEWDIPVWINSLKALPEKLPESARIHITAINGMEGIMKAKVFLTPMMIVNVIVFYSLSFFLTASIIFHGKKVINSVKANTPFTFQNIKRLRYISISVIAFSLIELYNRFYNHYLFGDFLREAGDIFVVKRTIDPLPIIIGMGIFVLSEIFRQGYYLKTDSESII